MASEPKVHNTLQQITEMLTGRTIASVEAGRTHGWVLIHFLPTADDDACRAFMTVWLGEDPITSEEEHHWNAAMHYVAPNRGSTAYPIRPFVESK
jgi:hypothetical protein